MSKAKALKLDREDSMAQYRGEFLFPLSQNGRPSLYFSGNSLGLQPKKTRAFVDQELDDWAKHGVEGHFEAKRPWLSYHEFLTAAMARVVGAMDQEVVVMNTLTVNLHLMMISFYRPTKTRFKILIEKGAFPSDQYAVASQASFHGFNSSEAILEICPRPGEELIRHEDILSLIEQNKNSLALIIIGNVNYLTGQAFNLKEITDAGHKANAVVGFDLAHGVGNLIFNLHDWNVDFAVWCGYKYLNGGPGSLGGCFIHERHLSNKSLPRFSGWWGHNKKTRFEMGPDFDAIPTAEGWQLSNPPIFSMAALLASLELFNAADILKLRQKSILLTGYLEELLAPLCQAGKLFQITGKDPTQRGCQLSLRFKEDPKELLASLSKQGVTCDFRFPDIIRVAPTPLYNSFDDIFSFYEILNQALK